MPHASWLIGLACPQVVKKVHCDGLPAMPCYDGGGAQASTSHNEDGDTEKFSYFQVQAPSAPFLRSPAIQLSYVDHSTTRTVLKDMPSWAVICVVSERLHPLVLAGP